LRRVREAAQHMGELIDDLLLLAIDRHGGQIWAENGVNHGATFYFIVAEPGPADAPDSPA